MSEEYAADTVKAVTSLARYAEYFEFDEATDSFTLENPGGG
jgi:NitT/TauT family transport system ATP-binding protein